MGELLRARAVFVCLCERISLSLCVSLTSVCVMILCDLCVSLSHSAAAMDGRCVVDLWYTLAMYLLDGAGTCEFEYVRVDTCV